MSGGVRRGIVLALVAIASTASAQPSTQLASIEDLDPMALARAVDRGGDELVLADLAGDLPSLAAIHATPFLRAPERALPRLAALAAGRDPWRAPAAMHAISAIADGPLLDELSQREADGLDEVLATLERLASDASAREDLRGAAALAHAQLTP